MLATQPRPNGKSSKNDRGATAAWTSDRQHEQCDQHQRPVRPLVAPAVKPRVPSSPSCAVVVTRENGTVALDSSPDPVDLDLPRPVACLTSCSTSTPPGSNAAWRRRCGVRSAMDGSSPVRRCLRVEAWPPTSNSHAPRSLPHTTNSSRRATSRARPGALTRVAAGPWTIEQPVAHPARPNFRLDLIPGEPDAARFPRAAWLRCTREVLATAPNDLFGYGDPAGLRELRAEIARYLNRTRNAMVAADATTVVPGAASGLDQVARLLHRQGATTIAVEEPGFPFHLAILRREGLRLQPVPVNDEGIDVDALAATDCARRPRHARPPVSPRHAMSPERRTMLVDWARRRDAWIIEDDYDGEFRYDRRPVGALQGIAPDRVVYLGTTSKTLGASLRIGWLVLPPALRTSMAEQRGRDSDVSQLNQAVLSLFIDAWRPGSTRAASPQHLPDTPRPPSRGASLDARPSPTSAASLPVCTSPSRCPSTWTSPPSSKQRCRTTASPSGVCGSTTRAATLSRARTRLQPNSSRLRRQRHPPRSHPPPPARRSARSDRSPRIVGPMTTARTALDRGRLSPMTGSQPNGCVRYQRPTSRHVRVRQRRMAASRVSTVPVSDFVVLDVGRGLSRRGRSLSQPVGACGW